MIAPASSADPLDRVDLVVDPAAEPADWDAAVAKFLLAFVRKRSRSSPAPEAEVQALRIGSGGIGSLPGEAFMELGQRIRGAFPDRPVLVAAYTNGSLGYIPTREAFSELGYEVTVAQRWRTIPIAEGGGEELADRAVAVLEEVLD